MASPMMRTKWRVRLVLDHVEVARLGVENEDGANLLIGNVQVVLGIDGEAVGFGELVQHLVLSLCGCVPASRSIHFAFLLSLPASTCEIFSAA